MCLSDAYEIRDGKESLVCSRVCNVSADRRPELPDAG